jgi:G:T/U-mismatch repair DNA glycosylase
MIKAFLVEKGIAIFDTALRIRRTKDTASDKDLEIVQPSDLDAMLKSLPDCKGVLTAGQLATEIFMRHYDIKDMPKMGQSVEFMFDGRLMKLYRMPSSSRAYPMQLEKKAEFYRVMFDELI